MKNNTTPFYLQKENIYAVPIIHYNMEMAAQVRLCFNEINPDCVAVELAETMELQLLHAASRLPDISIVVASDQRQHPLYYLCEPCDAAFEGLRSALENQVTAKCIDLDIDSYPDIKESLPDPYAIHRLGLKSYYQTYKKIAVKEGVKKTDLDEKRELHMARRLKELSLSYDRVLFIGGMAHIDSIMKLVDNNSFPKSKHTNRENIQVCTLTEDSCREVMAEYGWISSQYEYLRSTERNKRVNDFPPDRQKLIFQLYKEAATNYEKSTGNTFAGYHLRNTMKFVRNYALISDCLMPDLYQILCSAKGCVDHNYAYEVWLLGTQYPHLKNIDNLPQLDLKVEDVWGHSKIIRFHMKQQGRKREQLSRRAKDKSNFRFKPPGPFSICSHQPEDVIIENFGKFLQKKGTQILTDEGARTIPFSTSLEEGIDTKETIRHWYEKKLYVKTSGKPPGGVGSVVMIFNEDKPTDEDTNYREKYPWKTTWLGEHEQESDMAFYATDLSEKVVGPGISRCEYGGFMMSYPPRRIWDVWSDPDYLKCRSKSEVLLMAAIDYAQKPVVVYVASAPPRSFLKSFAQNCGKKIVYIPIGQLSPVTLNKIRVFHVLDGHDKRKIADEYIY
ncbi:MAG: hypothetical protein VX777_05510 [Chlamydiota bacterium]|nr:hypothetical protein [Chlamydiota bacterium]